MYNNLYEISGFACFIPAPDERPVVIVFPGVLPIMKYVYYGFGGFIGFICGVAINLIFYMLDQSGIKFAQYFIKNFGFFGRYILELINALPFLGAALGLILVKYLFGRELGEKAD